MALIIAPLALNFCRTNQENMATPLPYGGQNSEDYFVIERENTSAVWECFGHDSAEERDTNKTICKIYKTLLKHSGSTTNMKTHLSRHHPTHSTTTNTAKRNESTYESTYHSQNLIKTTVESNRKKTSQQTMEDCIKKQEKYPINRPRAINIAKQNEFFSVKINTRCQQWSVQGLETLCQQPRGIVSLNSVMLKFLHSTTHNNRNCIIMYDVFPN